MLNKLKLIKVVFENHKLLNAKISTVGPTKETWDLASAVCVERKPKLTRDLNEIERRYDGAIRKLEFELSYKSDHEMRKIKDNLYAEELKKGDMELDGDVSLQTAQEFEDSCDAELKKFKFAPRITEADVKCDLTSLNRKLSSSLLLAIKEHLGNKSHWILPQGVRQDGESMRQTAERVLKEKCGNELQTKFLGNAPCGFYKYRYPKSANKGLAVGMKIFFFKAQLIQGNVSRNVCSDFQWLAQNELNVLQEDYVQSVKMFLIDEEDNTL